MRFLLFLISLTLAAEQVSVGFDDIEIQTAKEDEGFY